MAPDEELGVAPLIQGRLGKAAPQPFVFAEGSTTADDPAIENVDQEESEAIY